VGLVYSSIDSEFNAMGLDFLGKTGQKTREFCWTLSELFLGDQLSRIDLKRVQLIESQVGAQNEAKGWGFYGYKPQVPRIRGSARNPPFFLSDLGTVFFSDSHIYI
jgi:hypothetical protein